MNISEIKCFLRFGYFLNYKNPRHNYRFKINNDYSNLDETQLIKIGSNLLLESIKKLFIHNSLNVCSPEWRFGF